MRAMLFRRILFIAIAGIAGFALAQPASVQAATLPQVRDYLSRQQGNLTSGETHQFFFTPATNLVGVGNQIIVRFPDNQDGTWCRTAGADLQVTPVTDPEGSTEGATPLPGTLVGTCTPGSGSSSFDTITVSGVDPLVAGTEYGVQVADGSIATLGTPAPGNDLRPTLYTNNGSTDIDSGLLHLALVPSDRVSISAVVAAAPEPTNPIVQFRGRSSVNASMTIIRDGTTIDSFTADSQAAFDVTLADQPTGPHTYELTARDTDGLDHPTLTFSFNLKLDTTTVVSGIFFGPTIHIDQATYTLGQTAVFSGRTVPGSTLALTIAPKTYSATADATGRWTVAVDTADLGIGAFHGSAVATASDLATSETSATIHFTVTSTITPPATNTPAGNKNITIGPHPKPGVAHADFNADGHVNIVDLSIMLYYWNQQNVNFASVDLNHDGKVNMIDFSILLYEWTG